MPTIEENKHFWNSIYAWRQGGDEWSRIWHGVDMQWYGTILPRIHAFVPAHTILEIAPGFGRWTQILKDLCENLIVVDLSEKCIRVCKERFRSCSHIAYYVNDGKSLDMIADESIDFAFSFDSLVHAEAEVMAAYIHQLAGKLKQDGIGFIHHSNLGEYADYFSLIKRLRWGRDFLVKIGLIEPSDQWRGSGMTASKFKQYAEEAGLQCLSQELVNWETKRLIDCITVFTKKGSIGTRPTKMMRNGDFMREAFYLSRLSQLYGAGSLANMLM